MALLQHSAPFFWRRYLGVSSYPNLGNALSGPPSLPPAIRRRVAQLVFSLCQNLLLAQHPYGGYRNGSHDRDRRSLYASVNQPSPPPDGCHFLGVIAPPPMAPHGGVLRTPGQFAGVSKPRIGPLILGALGSMRGPDALRIAPRQKPKAPICVSFMKTKAPRTQTAPPPTFYTDRWRYPRYTSPTSKHSHPELTWEFPAESPTKRLRRPKLGRLYCSGGQKRLQARRGAPLPQLRRIKPHRRRRHRHIGNHGARAPDVATRISLPPRFC